MNNAYANHRGGFTLLETIVAISVLAVATGAILSLVAFNRSALEGVEDRGEAAYLAQEGMEIVRNMRDANFLAIRKEQCDPIANYPGCWRGTAAGAATDLTVCSSGCEGQYDSTSLSAWSGDGRILNIDSNGLYSYGAGEESGFRRKITITEASPQDDDLLNVEVEVFWDDKTVTASGQLYNWLELPAPERSNVQVNGQPPDSTVSSPVTITLDTDQTAHCRYTDTADIRYDDTANNADFDITDSTSHSTDLSLSSGDYTHYVRCQGEPEFSNTNVIDLDIPFTVE